MVRHRRSEVAVMLPPRLAETILVTPGIDEAGLYADIVRRVRAAATGSGRTRLALRGLTRLAGSSPAAAAPTLAKLEWDDLAERARTIREPDKVRVLVELLRRHIARGEKVLVFTGFRQTLDVLVAAVERAGLPSASYHGSLTRREKESAIAESGAETPILLSTESAGEGRNLQFCHVMINVDLPWNPMQIEQRLGRLHRVGAATRRAAHQPRLPRHHRGTRLDELRVHLVPLGREPEGHPQEVLHQARLTRSSFRTGRPPR